MSNSVKELGRLLRNIQEQAEAENGKSTQFKDIEVVRGGDQITLPEGMSYPEGRKWLKRKEEAEEKEVSINHPIECYPLDGAYALTKALERIYGFTQLRNTPGMFGVEHPPNLVTLETGVDEFVEVVWGRMQPPGIEGYIETNMNTNGIPTFIVNGMVKRKHEEAIKRLLKLTEQIVREESVYRGKAIRMDLSFLEDGGFDPGNDTPKFMDVREVNENDLILNQEVMYDLTVSVFSRIEQTEAVLDNNVPFKHGVLLSGEYGVGKTFSARITAAKAERNDITFIYLEDAKHLAEALRFAKLYTPAVLFAEDIDKVIEGDRTEGMNRILNVLDGVDTKDDPILTILTTNYPDRINKAFLRAGRIDSVIKMGRPDAKTAVRFVERFASDYLAPNQNLEVVGEAFEGYVPAFISEGIHKAKMFAIAREGADIEGKVTAGDLVGAAETLDTHSKMVDNVQQPTRNDRIVHALETITSEIANGDSDKIAEIVDWVREVR